MIITENRHFTLNIPVLDNSKVYSGFQLVLQNSYTKQTGIIDLNNASFNPLRYAFEVSLPDMDYGDYEYYIVEADSWKNSELNKDSIISTQRKIGNTALSDKGQFIIIGNYMLVSKNFDENIQAGCTGDICVLISVVSKGILRYNKPVVIDNPVPEFKNDKNIIQYGG